MVDMCGHLLNVVVLSYFKYWSERLAIFCAGSCFWTSIFVDVCEEEYDDGDEKDDDGEEQHVNCVVDLLLVVHGWDRISESKQL